MTRKLNGWQLGIGGIVFLAIAYGFASWAINTGSLWLYALTILFLVAGIKAIVRAAKSLFKQ